MAHEKITYTLSDILGTPISEKEAIDFIQQNTDEDSFHTFNIMDEFYRKKLLHFIMGKNGLAITYDSVFKNVMMPGGTTERLEHFLSAILGEPVQIKQVLSREGSQIAETGSFIIADIIVSTKNGSIMNVEIQKIGYDFPGERASCYTADMIMRQYNYLKNKNKRFTYRDMKPVYLIVFMEKSPAPFCHSSHYIHNKHSSFDTGLKLNLLDNITFISLDTFHSLVQNITTEQDAWLKFLTVTDPDEIVEFVNHFPEFLPCYHDLILFRKNPKELISMFSDALRELDRNTEKYMVEQLHNQVVELKNIVAENQTILSKQYAMISEKNAVISEKDAAISEKDAVISEKDAEIAELKKLLAENSHS